MLRRPSPPPSPAHVVETPVLARRGAGRATLAGGRRRAARRDVPVDAGAGADAASGVVPRMRRPRGASGPAAGEVGTADHIPSGRGTALDQRIDHHLTRMRGAAHATRPGAFDDDRARRDPDTTSFAALRDAGPAVGATSSARVATEADRPRTAQLPAVSTAE